MMFFAEEAGRIGGHARDEHRALVAAFRSRDQVEIGREARQGQLTEPLGKPGVNQRLLGVRHGEPRLGMGQLRNPLEVFLRKLRVTDCSRGMSRPVFHIIRLTFGSTPIRSSSRSIRWSSVITPRTKDKVVSEAIFGIGCTEEGGSVKMSETASTSSPTT